MPIIEKTSEVIQPPAYPLLGSISNWGGKMVAPLNAPFLSRDGMLEVADRIKFIIALVLLLVVGIVARSRLASAPVIGTHPQPPPSVPGTPTLRPSSPAQGRSEQTRELNESFASTVKEINAQFDAIFSDLKQLNQPNNLERALKDFHEKFDKYNKKDENDFSTYFKAIEHIESNLRFLKNMRENLFLAPLRLNDKGIIYQPSDGNCLFHALGEGLKLLKENLIQRGTWKEEPLDHEPLRKKIVAWMQEHISRNQQLEGYIDRAVGDYIEVREGQYRLEQEGLKVLQEQGEDIRMASASLEKGLQEINELKAKDKKSKQDWYLAKAGHPAFFASSAEMYAFSQIYPAVSIHVWRELNGKYTNDFDAPFNESDLTINVAYNLNGDHFNNYIPPAMSR